MLMTVERIEKALVTLTSYLQNITFYTKTEAEECLRKLKTKGITGKAHEYEYDNNSYWGVHFEYHGWVIWVEEETSAERKGDYKEVYCP